MVSAKRTAVGLHWRLAISGYVFSAALLTVGIVSAWLSTGNYLEARSYDSRVAMAPRVPGFLHETATGENPRIKAVESRSAARLQLAVFIVTAILAIGGLVRAGSLMRHSSGGGLIASLPKKMGLPCWLPWEAALGAAAVVILGMGPLSSLLPEPEGTYEVTRIEVSIVEADFQERFNIAPGKLPKLFVLVKHNGATVANTQRDYGLVESYSASYDTSFRVRWRHEDETVFEVRDDDFIGSKLLMRGGGAKSGIFPLRGAYRSPAGSTISFSAELLTE